MKKQNFYTQNGWQGENYNRNLSCKELTALIRKYLKKQFPGCKFSVTKETGSLYWLINLSLMESNKEVLNYPALSEFEKKNKHIQLSKYMNSSEKLTDFGVTVLTQAIEYIESFNYDDSDGMIDYFDTNFYLHVSVGKWDKPFQLTKEPEYIDFEKELMN